MVVQQSLEATAGISAGDVLADRYRVERVLGIGGMGVVVAARHLELDEQVAIKFLLPHMLADSNAVARFLREAKAAVRIKSEHIARVLDVGRLGNGAPYMVMEYLDGADLAAWLSQRGAMPVDVAVTFVLQACVALADAHALGIVHRDLKPANLFCVRRSDGSLCIKVLDFGISKVADVRGSNASLTHTSAMMGSPLYMSPEQMRSSKNVDARADIWALGTILFEFLTGAPPFVGESVTELAIRIATEPTPSPRTHRPDIPPPLEAVVLRCLEKNPDQRFSNVAEMALALLPFAPPSARSSVERITGILSAAGGTFAEMAPVRFAHTAPVGTAPAVERTNPTAASRSRAPRVAIGIVAAALLGTGAFLYFFLRHEPSEVHQATLAAPSATPPAPPSASPAPVVPVAAPVAAAPASTGEWQPPPDPTPERRIPPPPTTAAPARPAALPAANRRRPAAAPAGARPNCDPPYFFDDQGNRIFKPECI